MTIKEAQRTGNAAVRAAVLKNGKPLIRWYWYDSGAEINPMWFD
jgi:hypothetical protein